MSTYKTMDISDLGDNATEADLRAFADACRVHQLPNETDEEVTERLWNNGDWQSAIGHPEGCSCGSPDCPELQRSLIVGYPEQD